MPFTGPLEDRILIRERFGSYADATFRCDVDAYLACWREDGIRRQGDQEACGKSGLRAHWESAWQHLDKMTFFAEIGAIEISGDRATTRSYCREILFLKNGGVRKVVGQYDDVLVRQDGDWLFARKAYRLLMDEGTRGGLGISA